MSPGLHSRLKHEGAMARISGSWFANELPEYLLSTAEERKVRRQGYREEANREQTRKQRAERNKARRKHGKNG